MNQTRKAGISRWEDWRSAGELAVQLRIAVVIRTLEPAAANTSCDAATYGNFVDEAWLNAGAAQPGRADG